jgi:biotin carboxylase
MKNIMILGAGIYQVPLIKKAKSIGYYTIVVSIPGDYPGFNIADEIAYIDTTDYLNVCELAKRKKIDAILTTGTDVALITIGYICDKLKLTGISFEAAKLSTNKALMKKAFKEGGVSTAEYMIVSSYEEAEIAARTIGYPIVIKIVDKSGSRGITKVNSEEALKDAYEYGETFTDTDYLIVEKYISAHEIGIDAFIQNGDIVLFLPHDKMMLSTKRTNVPKGHICPLNLSDEMYKKLLAQTRLVIKALKLNNCSVNMDVFIDKYNDVYVIEATGRCGGTGIPEVISAYANIDYYKIMIDNALGKLVEFSNKYNNYYVASSLIFSSKTGRLRSITYNENLLDENDIFKLDYGTGHFIHEAENGTDRIGMLLASANDREVLMKKIHDFDKSVNVCIETDLGERGFKGDF